MSAPLEKPRISVIVAGGAGPGALEATLRGVASASRLPGQTLVLAWPGPDAVTATALGAAVLDLPAGLSLSAARNQVVGVLDTEWLGFLQAGLCVDEGWDRLAVERLASDPGTGAVGGRQTDAQGRVRHAGFQGVGLRVEERLFEARYLGGPAEGPASRMRHYQSVSEHCLVLAREDFLAVGGFDPALAADYAGHDLCFKLRFQRGKDVAYDPACSARWTAQACPPADAPVRMGDHRAFFARWKDRLFADYAIWDAVDGSEARTGRGVPDYGRLL